MGMGHSIPQPSTELLKVGILPFPSLKLTWAFLSRVSPPLLLPKRLAPDAHPLPRPPPLSTTQTNQLEGLRHWEQPLSLPTSDRGAWSVLEGCWDSIWSGLVSENRTGARVSVCTHTHAPVERERLTNMCVPAVGAADASEAKPGVRRQRRQKRERLPGVRSQPICMHGEQALAGQGCSSEKPASTGIACQAPPNRAVLPYLPG